MNTTIKNHLYRFLWIGLDWFFPPVCGGCGKPGTRWCSVCQNLVQVITGPVCDACGLPLETNGLCERCKQQRPDFRNLRAWAVFENPVQNAIHRLKYRRDIGLGEAIANQMSSFVRDLDWPIDLLIPIPLGKKRYKDRGYNQVSTVAMPLSLQLGLNYRPDCLRRTRETRSQVGLTATERKENVSNAFFADEKKVKHCSVLLIDDVSTTGATLSSASKALYNSDAREVYALTIARALPHHSIQMIA